MLRACPAGHALVSCTVCASERGALAASGLVSANASGRHNISKRGTAGIQPACIQHELRPATPQHPAHLYSHPPSLLVSSVSCCASILCGRLALLSSTICSVCEACSPLALSPSQCTCLRLELQVVVPIWSTCTPSSPLASSPLALSPSQFTCLHLEMQLVFPIWFTCTPSSPLASNMNGSSGSPHSRPGRCTTPLPIPAWNHRGRGSWSGALALTPYRRRTTAGRSLHR